MHCVIALEIPASVRTEKENQNMNDEKSKSHIY